MIKPHELFAGYEGALAGFASKYNLQTEKYRHDMPRWSFSGQHPKGGIARIELGFNYERVAHIQRWWTFDDYDKCFRAIRYEESQSVNIVPENAIQILESNLREIIGWELGMWTHKFKEFWRLSRSRKEFMKQQNSYPTITLHENF